MSNGGVRCAYCSFSRLPRPLLRLAPSDAAAPPPLLQLINSCLHSAIKREKLMLAVEADNYIPKLMRMFQMCEDLENTAGLHHLHDIIINLFQLNKNALIESMFKGRFLPLARERLGVSICVWKVCDPSILEWVCYGEM